MSKETPKDDPHQQSDHASHKQTDKPWKGNPEKEQRNDAAKIDLEKWHGTKTHYLGGAAEPSRLRCKVSDACAPRVLVAVRRAFACNERCRAALDMLEASDLNTRGTTSRLARLNKERSRMRTSFWSLIRNLFGSKILLRNRRCGGDHEEEK